MYSLAILILELEVPRILFPEGVYKMLRAQVCAAHMGGFFGAKFSKQGSFLGIDR